jgi:hypothetical protein
MLAGGMREPQHAFTLAFRDAELELAYRQHTADGVRRWYRITAVLAFLGFAVSWFADPLTMGTPENGEVLRWLRLAVGLPLLAPVVAFAWAPDRWFERAWAPVALAGIAIMILVPLSSLMFRP